MHRILCFHKLNDFTPVQAAQTTNQFNVYRIWKVALLWFMVFGILINGALGLVPFNWLAFLALSVGAVLIIVLIVEMNRDISELAEEQWGEETYNPLYTPGEELWIIRRFESPAEARLYARTLDTNNLTNAKIKLLNPAYDNLNRQSARSLSSLNTMI